MKAVYFESHGGPEVLQVGELAEPAAARGEVAIEVHATSVNHLDLFVRRGMPGVEIPLPHVPGCDAAGVVAELGEGVAGISVGDRVVINPSIAADEFEVRVVGEHTNGACAERIVVPFDNVIPIPDHVAFEDAAAVPLVFVTAWRMLMTRARLVAGEDVLILGGAAGVGAACIQIAKHAGARVLAAASTTEKLDFCRELGADVLINYTKDDFADRVRRDTGKRGVDVAVDYVGQETWGRSLKSLRRGGRLVTCGATTGFNAQTDLRYVFYNQLEIIGSSMGTKEELMAPLRLLFNGELRSMVNHVFDLEQTADAHRLMESRKVIGKVVIHVR